MLRFILFRFWPVFIPLLVYWVWMLVVRQRAEKQGKTKPKFSEGPWFWAVLASLLIAALLLLALGLSAGDKKGEYVPPHMENGELVPGQVKP